VSTRTEELRMDIAEERRELADSIEAIGDRVSPGRVVERRTNRVKDRLATVKETVMGAAPSMPSMPHPHAPAMSTPSMPDVAGTARGNPLAAGLVAFGTGLLAAAVFPATRKEAEVAQTAREAVEPVAQEVGREVASGLQDKAKEAAEQVKATATEGAEQVKQAATTASEHARDAASDATAEVKDQASS
jgi:gas vesicle protein